jgi:hypothetical protein
MTTELNPLRIRPTTEEDWEILKTIRLAALLDSPTAFGLSYATAASYRIGNGGVSCARG